MGLLRKDIQTFSDEELMVLLASKRRNEALTELHSRYARRILGFFIRMFQGDQAKAQDFTQDLFLKLLEKHRQFNPEKKLYTWMFVIASNMCKTEFRKQPAVQIPVDESTILNDSKLNENRVDKSLFNKELKHSVEALDEHHRISFVLRYMQELSIKEIAEITEVSEGTVKSRLYYATKKITTKLEVFNPRNEGNLFKIQ